MKKAERKNKARDGIQGIRPEIKKISFEKRGMITILLQDGRELSVPLSHFPSIKRIPKKLREKYTVGNGQLIMFHYSDEIFHLEQFLGKENDYSYKFEKV